MKAIYKHKPFVLLSKEGIVLFAGSYDEILDYKIMPYYRDCTVKVREHDLYLNDNTKGLHKERTFTITGYQPRTTGERGKK